MTIASFTHGQDVDEIDLNALVDAANDHETRITERELLGTLGYAQVTTTQALTAGTEADLSGLSVTVTVGTSRRIRVSGYGLIASTVSGDRYVMRIKEGSTTLTQHISSVGGATTAFSTAHPVVVLASPGAGSHTYKLSLQRIGGSGNPSLIGDPAAPAFILVEDIGT